MKLLDYGSLFLFAAGLFFASFPLFYKDRHDTGMLVISSGSKEWIFPLDIRDTVEIPGDMGITKISISREGVEVLDSPCKNKLCVLSGQIKHPGEYIACIPNRVFIFIDSPKEQKKGINLPDLDNGELSPDIISY